MSCDELRQQVLNEWQASYEGAVSVTSTSTAAPKQLRLLRVVTRQGRPLAELPVDST